ncbi:cilia- and flagella-associated protein 91, partial [Hyalella azteca]|uniref:Cilia- and flagella-associated protein 91 n=1 Tax=Hyalella azteca TaxID=294128 RepID=A0A8B7NGU5_HYAAZ
MGCENSKDVVHPMNRTTYPPRLEEDAEMFDIDLNDPEVQKAAAKIQAGFRGHKTRKEINREKPEANKAEADEIADIDLTDPELANAALKIQAGFRGHIARKQNKPTEELPSKMTGLNMKDDAA